MWCCWLAPVCCGVTSKTELVQDAARARRWALAVSCAPDRVCVSLLSMSARNFSQKCVLCPTLGRSPSCPRPRLLGTGPPEAPLGKQRRLGQCFQNARTRKSEPLLCFLPAEVTVRYRHGLPLLTLTLPSRRERCQFVVKPLLSTVGSFLQDLQDEDRGIKSAAIHSSDGSLIPASTLMEILLRDDFKLVVNEMTYDVRCPPHEPPRGECTAESDRVKSLVHSLFTALHLEELRKKREHQLLQTVSRLKAQLLPLEQVKARIEARADAQASGLLWAGLALLSVQGGALAWLTWWVYSWDLMEPVTYFITFANSMVFFAYFLVTRQDYAYSAIKNRQFLHFFHKKSKKQHFDVVQYNQLKEDLAKVPAVNMASYSAVLSGVRTPVRGVQLVAEPPV
ncbi:Calcium uniporter regulatory subunit MCUb, mitochondrial [Galemys pyrenaicus]|uniref:Calcium uniporter protein n=1 Tax=Galemys pyrenaicus TaxID=202257 RepID=A0A8J6ADE9_GALPY|nr:Calcium uniporter regulatory subunit MCUb, mitochondrial [Galemys pyrenaicus]